ncbi:MAG TPA: N-acetylmuramoyl-L-alanine amidase, partial [Candidatus Angelobacter sp.]
NSHGLCIENLGDFDTGKDNMSAAQEDCIPKVNALLCRKFNLKPSTDSIVFHHWFDLVTGQRTNGAGSTKTCPGTGFFGGNTVSSAQANFIPLIVQELANLAGSQAASG